MIPVGMAVLWVFWPNFVHEPLHLLALKVQWSDGIIRFGLHPTIERTAPVVGVGGGLFYLLFPSIVSGILLGVFSVMHPRFWTHFVLGPYLAFDLLMNIFGFRSSTSDFHWLIIFGDGVVQLAGAAVIVVGLWIVWKATQGLVHEQKTES